jgi:hypothetical protein
LLELRITQPRRRYPAWALWVGVLLALNAAVLLYALLRRPAATQPAIAASAAAPAATSAASLPAAITHPSAPGVSSSASSAPGVPGAPVPAVAAAANPGPNVTVVAPLAAAPGVAAGAAGASSNAPASVSANPADDEPAVSAAASPSRPVDYSGLPSLASLGGEVPALQLNLLDYSALADERFALINMHRVREGDVLPEGPRVLAIMRNGVALDYRGQEFMLHSGGSSAAP